MCMDMVRDAIFVYNQKLPESLASTRVMALIPARHLGMRALYFGAGTNPDAFLDEYQPRVLCLMKAADASMLQLAKRAKERGVRLISAFCDWYFDGKDGQLNRSLSDISDSVVVQTRPMADEFERYFGRRPVLIEEAIEYPRETPQFAPGHTLKLTWYGRDTNFDALMPGLRRLARYRERPMHILVISNKRPDIERAFEHSSIPSNMKFDSDTWSMEAQYDAMQWCDFVFVPGLDVPSKLVKGHNRLVEAINAGRLALVYPLPQYRELGEYCWCSDDYSAGINWALSHPDQVLSKLARGQEYIDTRFSPKVIAARWRAEIERVMAL